MKTITKLLVTASLAVLLAHAQDAKPRRVGASQAKDHVGETAMVCGKVVATTIPKYGIAGHGKPVSFYLDQPESDPVFYFVAFGSESPQEVVNAYQGKSVCVSGKIDQLPSGRTPFIMAADRVQVQIDTHAH